MITLIKFILPLSVPGVFITNFLLIRELRNNHKELWGKLECPSFFRRWSIYKSYFKWVLKGSFKESNSNKILILGYILQISLYIFFAIFIFWVISNLFQLIFYLVTGKFANV
nr:putative integron gene cassette protein [uncultured bacterium]CAP48327.1 putative integron gene cassette protein [uncultured bacterium]CAP49048.1 putative integron gene cassette protein [uncultured bacterium]